MSGKIFINYRRTDDPGFAGRLFDRLEETFTPEQLFMDIDSIELGDDFVRVLEDEVDRCDIFLAIIGPKWLDADDAMRKPLFRRTGCARRQSHLRFGAGL
jgi:hypothetical protein